MKTYALSLHRNYVAHWGVANAVRELIQNAIDSDGEFFYEFRYTAEDKHALRLRSSGVTLDTKTLLLGATDKRNDASKIGSFGEGYKIALLVLTREECPVIVRNGYVTWEPYFAHSQEFDDVLLHINETEEVGYNDLEFIISDISTAEKLEIIESCLLMQSSVGKVTGTPQGDILHDKPGKLYVGDLFICNTELQYGYNIKPELIKLERDRQTVDSFNLKWITKDMWASTRDHTAVLQMLKDEVPDVEFLEYVPKPTLRDAAYSLFTGTYGNSIPVTSKYEADKLVERGVPVNKIVQLSSKFYKMVTESLGFKTEIADKIPAEEKVHEVMQDWFKDNQKHMNRYGKVNFNKLIALSRNWVKK